MIRTYEGFLALRHGVEEFPSAGGMYTQPKIDRNTIADATFVVIPSMEIEECVEEQGGSIPAQLEGRGYHEWLEAAMVQAIVQSKLDINPQATLTEMIDAVFYYLEYDTFQDA